MANDIHVILSPKVLDKPSAQLTLSFDAPKEAENVVVRLLEVDAWGTGPDRVQEGDGKDTLIAELTGKIVAGKFKLEKKDPKGATGTKPAIQLHIDGEEKPLFVVHDLPIPSSTLGNEDGIYEIEAEVTATVNKKKAQTRTPTPVFVRDFKAGRPVAAFITGGGAGYFEAAGKFWKIHADGKFNIGSVEAIREFLNTASDARGFGPWGDVNIVSHAAEFQWFIRLFKTDADPRALAAKDVVQARSDPRFAGPVSAQLDEKTRVIIRGCVLGNDQALLDQIRLLFGGKVTVFAPKFVQTYFTDSKNDTAREVFLEEFVLVVPGENAPPVDECKRKLAAANPGVKDSDWMPMLQRPEKVGRLSAKEIEEQLQGHRKDKTEVFTLRRTFTLSHASGKPSSNKDGAAIDFVSEARPDWKNDLDHFNTDFNDWAWTPGPLNRRELSDSETQFARLLVGKRHKVEIRRMMKDSQGNPVNPDPNNLNHFGRSAPSATP